MLVLGLDAADSSLVQKWSDEGILPTLALLRKEGAWIPLEQDRPIPSAAVWPSIYTGVHPGQHGIYHTLQIEAGKQEFELLRPEQSGEAPFWRLLDRHGKASIIMDVPFSYPLEDFGGIQVLDWGCYERHYRPQSSPDEILTEMSKRFGAYPFGEEMSRDTPSSKRHFSQVRAELLAAPPLKGKVISWLMRDRPWDFLMAVFSETHPVGHYFWSFHFNGHGNRDSSLPPEFKTTIKDVYRAVDTEIGKIVENLDDETTLVVLSGQGMGPNPAKWHVIPEVLSNLGLLGTKARPSWLAESRDLIPREWRRWVSRYLPGALRDILQVHWANAGFDWSQTRAFHMPTDLLGYIRINRKGREPHGVVEPGAEYDLICAEITQALKALVDPETGAPIVREVFRGDEIFAGPQRHRFPDLIVCWHSGPEVRTPAAADPVGQMNGCAADHRSGNHRPEGFALFCGPGVKKAQTSQGHITDIAPTILKYFGLTPPATMAGRDLLGC
jgi:predicted AlkP superfamily phosphohydrolase/phosphomutase